MAISSGQVTKRLSAPCPVYFGNCQLLNKTLLFIYVYEWPNATLAFFPTKLAIEILWVACGLDIAKSLSKNNTFYFYIQELR